MRVQTKEDHLGVIGGWDECHEVEIEHEGNEEEHCFILKQLEEEHEKYK